MGIRESDSEWMGWASKVRADNPIVATAELHKLPENTVIEVDRMRRWVHNGDMWVSQDGERVRTRTLVQLAGGTSIREVRY